MKILVIAANFPSESRPQNGIFVKNLLVEFVRLGHEVIVISPQKFIGDSMPKKNQRMGMKYTDQGLCRLVTRNSLGLKQDGFLTCLSS